MSYDEALFEEMAALRTEHPSLRPAAVLRMATANGARALGLSDRLGSIQVDKLAALVVVPLPDAEADPLEVICSAPPQVYGLEQAPWEGGP